MGLLTKEAILKAEDLPRELVIVPEWGGEVWVRGLSGAERDRFEADGIEVRGKTAVPKLDNIRARLAALAVCDEKGKRLFSDAEATALGAKSGRALDRVCDVARRLGGLSQAAGEEAEKNSAAAPSGASGSS